MIGKAGNITEVTLSRAQIRLELESARKTVDRLARTIQLVGDAGVADSETSNELDVHLGAAYAAAHRWLLESRLQAAGTGIGVVP
ncbi:hypothetical protein [Hyphomonas sp.]|uniref:hypothetical protein n=1 Tax=Hyphomonas sp. TaxID=87 RepID=UPI0035664C86